MCLAPNSTSVLDRNKSSSSNRRSNHSRVQRPDEQSVEGIMEDVRRKPSFYLFTATEPGNDTSKPEFKKLNKNLRPHSPHAAPESLFPGRTLHGAVVSRNESVHS